jgi:WD40 repeat protein
VSGVFVAGGTMRPGAPTYIERTADSELYEAVLAGEYCSVLTTRQMGKSSLMARTAARLRERGIACATVDLQGKGDENTPREQWYYGFLKQLADGLGVSIDLAQWWKREEPLPPAQRLTDFFAAVVLTQLPGRVAVFIDEVDWMIRLPFSDEFFAAIRSCFNRRATDPPFERLSFVLLGSASPSQLIKDATRTPFNVGRGIELTDFTPAEAMPLASWLGDDGEAILARILHWTDGHPYLTQMLCAKTVETGRDGRTPEAAVDSLVQEKLLSTSARQEENNLKFVADRLTQGTGNLRRVLRAYRDVLRGKPVKDVPASPVHTSLRLSGAVKPDAGRLLRVRNRIYGTVFNERWLREKTPHHPAWTAGAVAAAALIMAFSAWYWLVFPRDSVQTLEFASADLDVAYRAYDRLRKPLHRARADELLAQFFERRGHRDAAILVRAKAGDRAGLAGLTGADFPSLRKTFRHERAVSAVSFSPDGRLLATGSGDQSGDPGIGRVFEVSSGREISRLTHQAAISAVAFTPDRKLVLTFSKDNTARVFDAATGRELSRVTVEDPVDAVAFSSDANRVATGSMRKGIRVFDAATGREMRGPAPTKYAVVFIPGLNLAATGLGGPTPQWFGAATGKKRFPAVEQDGVRAAALSPDGRLLAIASEHQTVCVLDTATGGEVSCLAHEAGVGAVAFSPNGKLVATASDDATARVFEAATGREMSRLVHESWVSAVVFSPDGKLVATGSGDQTARIFEAAPGPPVFRLTPQRSVGAVAFSPDGKLLATGAAFEQTDGAARVFDAATGREVSRLMHGSRVSAIAFSPDGTLVATGSADNTARVFEAATGRERSRLLHRGRIDTVAFSPDGKLVATGSLDNTARVFEAATGRQVLRLDVQSVYAVAFSPDGKLVAVGSFFTSRVVEVASGREVSRLYHPNNAISLAFSPDGKLLAMGSWDKVARIFEVATGREIFRLTHGDLIAGVAFSSDGHRLFAQHGNWLHVYERSKYGWRPVANRHLPVLWPLTLRSVPRGAACSNCVEVVRDIPESLLKLERIDFDEPPARPVQGDPQQFVADWSARLGLTIDSRGRIAPLIAPGN